MVSSTSARPLIPEPPMPMKWILRARPYMSGLVLVGGVAASGQALARGTLGRRVGSRLEQAAGDPLRCIGAREAARVDRHADQRLAVLEQAQELERQALTGEVAVADRHGAAALGQVLRVDLLVVVGGERVGHED